MEDLSPTIHPGQEWACRLLLRSAWYGKYVMWYTTLPQYQERQCIEFPTVAEYKAFCAALQSAGQFHDTLPGTETALYHVESSLQRVQRVDGLLLAMRRDGRSGGTIYSNARKILSYEKAAWATLANKYEDNAKTGKAYEKRRDTTLPNPQRTNSAINASVFASASSATDDAAPSISAPISSDGKKKVRFSTDTVDHSQRDDDEFDRKSEYYQPGRHACPSPDGWADTSFMKYKPEMFWPSDSDSDSDSDEDTDTESEEDDSEGEKVSEGEDLSDLDVDEYIVSVPDRRHSREESGEDEPKAKRHRGE